MGFDSTHLGQQRIPDSESRRCLVIGTNEQKPRQLQRWSIGEIRYCDKVAGGADPWGSRLRLGGRQTRHARPQRDFQGVQPSTDPSATQAESCMRASNMDRAKRATYSLLSQEVFDATLPHHVRLALAHRPCSAVRLHPGDGGCDLHGHGQQRALLDGRSCTDGRARAQGWGLRQHGWRYGGAGLCRALYAFRPCGSASDVADAAAPSVGAIVAGPIAPGRQAGLARPSSA